MATWTTEDKVRRKIGLNSEDVEDDVITPYIEEAQADMLRDISHSVIDEKLSGNIDGTNTTFSTSYPYIADTNFDLTIDGSDIKVYGWSNEDDPSTKVTLSVSTVHNLYGKIVLSDAPTNIVKITADYNYYDNPINLADIPETCAYLAAFYYGLSEIVLMPKQWMHGAYRFLKTEDIGLLEQRYWEKIHALVKKVHEVGEYPNLPTGTYDGGYV